MAQGLPEPGLPAPRRPVLPTPHRVAILAGLLAASCVAVAWVPSAELPAGMVMVPWWALAVVFAATEVLVFRIRVRREEQSVSISELPLVIGLFALGPWLLLVSRLVGSATAFAAFRRTTPLKTCFNLALVGAGTVVAVATFHAVAQGAPASSPRGWLAAIAATAASGTLDGLVLTLVISWYDGWPSLRVVGEQLVSALALPAAVSVAGIVATVALMGGPSAVVPLLLACVVVLLGYRAYALLTERHAEMTRLFGLSDALQQARTVDEVARAAVANALELMRARSAELLVHPRGGARVTRWHAGHGGETSFDDSVGWPHPAFAIRPRGTVRGATDAERALLDALGQQEAVVVPLPLGEDLDGVLLVGERLGEERGYRLDDVRMLETVGNHVDIALRHATVAERLRYEALHDHLTGLPNRGVFRRRADEAAEAALHGGPAIAIGVLDLDGFKTVNDSLGHQAGDQVIAEVARRLERAAGQGVELGRLGGDEFAVLVRDATDQAGVTAVARRLIASLEEPLVIGGEHLRLGGSLGFAIAPRDGGNADALLRSADIAMYSAKQESGGYRFYAREMAAANDAPLSLAGDLRLALGRGELSLSFQPLIALDTGRLHSVEALARWRHPALGFVDPESFIVAAERGGLVQELTGVVLQQAIAACRSWLDAGVTVRVAVNLAARTLGDAWLPNTVGRLLEQYGVPGRLLCLELTEGGVIASPERALAVVTKLRELGVQVAVDDFGTGYSSMTYLSWLAPDQVKIDKSFVLRLGAGSRHEAIIRSIIDLGKNLAVEVVAEGVSDARTAAMLRHLGCRLAQGYYFAEPMPGEELIAWAEGWTSRSWIGDSAAIDLRELGEDVDAGDPAPAGGAAAPAGGAAGAPAGGAAGASPSPAARPAASGRDDDSDGPHLSIVR
jgi:diguanylate cyclase (GGDEF)-like protein